MNASLKKRLTQLEVKRGDPTTAYLNSLSDEQLEARIAEIHVAMRAVLFESGIDCSDLDDDAMVKKFEDFEAAHAQEKA